MKKAQRIFSLFLLLIFNLFVGNLTPAAATKLTLAPTSSSKSLGTIRGIVRDERGAPIAKAVIALWRGDLASVRQVQSGNDGSFLARVVPGRYSLTAMANGFNVVSLSNVDVQRAEEVAFRFNLIRVGGGYTFPERKNARSNPKWRILANSSRRTIYQNNEGTGETLAQIGESVADEAKTQIQTRAVKAWWQLILSIQTILLRALTQPLISPPSNLLPTI